MIAMVHGIIVINIDTKHVTQECNMDQNDSLLDKDALYFSNLVWETVYRCLCLFRSFRAIIVRVCGTSVCINPSLSLLQKIGHLNTATNNVFGIIFIKGFHSRG